MKRYSTRFRPRVRGCEELGAGELNMVVEESFELEREAKLGVPGGRQGISNHLGGAMGWVPLGNRERM